MPTPTDDGYTLAQVWAAIEPGRPDSITTAGGAFAAAVGGLTTLASGIGEQVAEVTGGDSARWSGPAAQAFTGVITDLVARIGRLAETYRPYQPALDPASTALQTAREELVTVITADTAARDAGPAQAEAFAEVANAEARRILATLAAAYATAQRALTRGPNAEDSDGREGLDGPTEDDPAVTDPAAVAGLDPAALAGLDPVGLDGVDLAALPGLGSVPLAGLVPVDLGAGPRLALGALDSSTYLAGLDPMPNPSLVLGRGSSPLAPLPPLETALTGGGLVGPGLGGPGFALTPVSHLTTASGPTATAAGAPPAAPGGTRPPFLPMTPMGGVGPVGPGSSSRRRGPLAGALGRPVDEADETEHRTSLVGDEEWTDGAGLSGAIGRESDSQSTRG